jgi:hypothetical protein
MRIRTLLAFLVLVAVLAGGYAAWWFYLAGMMRDGLNDWAMQERKRGGAVEFQGLRTDGFPFEVTAVADAVSIRRADGSEWQGARTVGRLAPWNPREIRLTLDGQNRFRTPALGNRPGADITATGGAGAFTLGLDQGHLALTDIVVDQRITARGLDIAGSRPATPPQNHTETGLTVQMQASGITLPAGQRLPLGRAVENAALTAEVKGPLPDDLGRAAVAAWSNAGGTVEINSLGLNWGPLRVTADGTVALDHDLQPQGALSAAIEGLNPTLDAAVTAGLLRPNDAVMAKVGLGLLARRKTADDQPIVDAPLTVQNGWFYVGPIRLTPVPRIPWPQQ